MSTTTSPFSMVTNIVILCTLAMLLILFFSIDKYATRVSYDDMRGQGQWNRKSERNYLTQTPKRASGC